MHTPSSNIEMEKAVIGCMLIDGREARNLVHLIDVKWFYHNANITIFELLKNKIEDGVEPDLPLVATWLTTMDQLANVGGTMYLADCCEAMSTMAHTHSYIHELRKCYYDRQIYAAAQNVAKEPTYANNEVLRALYNERDSAISNGSIDLRNCADKICALTDPMEKGMYELFGMGRMDEIHNGAMPGNIMTIGARPGVGKTVLSTHVAVNFAKKYNEPVLYFTTEMPHEETLMRILAPETKIPGWKFRKRVFNQHEDIPAVIKAAQTLTKLPIFINDKPAPTLGDIQAGILSSKCKLVIIDYIQRLNLEIGPRDSRPEAIGRMMMGIKNTCRDLGILAVVLSQMDRETDRLTGRQRPQLADLKGSGDIEQESDAIGLMWRHNKKDKETKKGIVPDNIPMIRPVEFIWAKNRHGASDVSVQMVFDEKFIEFREWNDAEEQHCRNLAMQATSDKSKQEAGHGKSETTGLSHYSSDFTEEPGD